MNSNQHKFTFTRLLLGVILGVALLFGQAPAARGQTAPDLQSVNPDFAYWGEVIQLFGENFGTYVDDSSTYVTFISTTTSEETKATVHFPPDSHWTDRSIRVDVPADLAEGNYNLVVHTAGVDTGALLFTIQDYLTPNNIDGTPDYTADYIISNTQTINVSDAIRRIAQGMLLPSKETITELGRYLEDALVFKLDIGADSTDAGSSKQQLEKIYEVARNISNTLFLFFIVISAFFLIFRVGSISLSRYSLRQIIPRFFVAIFMVNAGFVISRILTDFTLILTHVILDQVKLPAAVQLSTLLLGDLRLSLFVLFMLGFYLLVSSIIALVAIMLILRVVAVWLLIAISPLAFLLIVFPKAESFALNWFKRFFQLLSMGPAIAFLLFVGTTLSQGATAIGNPDVLRAMIGTATLGLILATPFWITGLFSSMSQLTKVREQKTSSKETSKTVVREREKESEKTLEKTDRASINQRLGFQDIDVSNVLTKTPSIENLEARIQNAIIHEEGSTHLVVDGSDSVVLQPAAESPAAGTSPAPRSQPTPRSEPIAAATKAPATTIAEPTLASSMVTAAARPARNDNVKQQNSAQKLFASAPKTLLVNWLSDQSKHAFIRDGIVETEGKMGSEKAVAIFDSPDGKQILGQMVEGESAASQQASATMISDVMLTYPDRITQVIEDSEHATPPINLAAQAVLKAGIAKLGERLLESPNDERLQKAAERVVQYAPHLLTNILSMPTDTGAGFIRVGIDQVAANIGGQLLPLLPGQVANNQSEEQKAKYQELSSLATQTLLFPEVHLEQLGKSAAEKAFVAVAATSDTPDSARVIERIRQGLLITPENVSLQAVGAEIVKLSDQSRVTTLPAEILSAARTQIEKTNRADAFDLGLLAKFITAAPLSAMARLSIPDDVLVSGLGLLNQQFKTMGIDPASSEIAARLLVVTPPARLQTLSAEQLTAAETGLTELAISDPELALLATLKLASALPSGATLTPNLTGLMLQAWEHGTEVKELSRAERSAIAAQLLLAPSPTVATTLAQNLPMQRSLISALYQSPTASKYDSQVREQLPAIIKRNPLLATELLAASIGNRTIDNKVENTEILAASKGTRRVEDRVENTEILAASKGNRPVENKGENADIERYLSLISDPGVMMNVDTLLGRSAAQHILEQPFEQLPDAVKDHPEAMGRLLHQALAGVEASAQLDWLTTWAPQFAQMTVQSPQLASSAAVEILAASDPVVIPPPPIVQTAYNGLVAHAADYDPAARQAAAIRLLTDQPTQDQVTTTKEGFREVLLSALPVGASSAEVAAVPALAELLSQPQILVKLDLPKLFPGIAWPELESSKPTVIKSAMLSNVLPTVENPTQSGLASLLGKLLRATTTGQVSPETSQSILASLPLVDIPQILSDPKLQSSMSAQLREHPERINDPELSAKILLITPETDIETLPWKFIKQVLEYMMKMDKESPLYKELARRAALHPESDLQSEQLRSPATALPHAAKTLETPSVSDVSAPEQRSLTPPSVQLIEQTPFDKLGSLPISVVQHALEALQASPSVTIGPELAAKLTKMVPLEALKDLNQPVREAAANYLMSKPDGTHSAGDAEIAARLVAATPSRYLIGLNQSILTLAATIAKSNLSFADRDQLQEEIGRELRNAIEQNKPENAKTDEATNSGPVKELSKPVVQDDEEDEKTGVFHIDI